MLVRVLPTPGELRYQPGGTGAGEATAGLVKDGSVDLSELAFSAKSTIEVPSES